MEIYFKKFRNVNLQLPQKIVVYRDLVSDSQFIEILAIELAGMRAACKEIEVNYEPVFTIVIVQKRHRAQFPRLGG